MAVFGEGFYVYILKCGDDSYYVGHTDNMEKRLWEHQNKIFESSYVSQRQPVELAFCDVFETRNEAREAERMLKGWSRKKKQALIWGGIENMQGYCKQYEIEKKKAKQTSEP